MFNFNLFGVLGSIFGTVVDETTLVAVNSADRTICPADGVLEDEDTEIITLARFLDREVEMNGRMPEVFFADDGIGEYTE